MPDLTRGLQQFVDVLSTPSETRLQQQLDSGATALALASKWLDHWLGRVLAFLANSDPVMRHYGDDGFRTQTGQNINVAANGIAKLLRKMIEEDD